MPGRKSLGGAYIARGRAFMRITTAPGVRTPKALPWVTERQRGEHDGEAADPCACVAYANTAALDRYFASGAPLEASKATGINGDEDDTSAESAGAVYVY